jgi:hypothetical protein
MSKKRREARKQKLQVDKIVDDMARRRTFNRGNLMLLISIIWLIGLFLIVAKYGKLF